MPRTKRTAHICDATINPCTCGRRWDYQRTYRNDDGTTSTIFTTAEVKAKFEALYGMHHGLARA